MQVILKVDNRERSLHEHLDAVFNAPPMFVTDLCQPQHSQLEIGDFIIVAEKENFTQVLAVIERKTLKDYAASLKDGRIINTEKLIRLREETGCQVYYLIEGGLNVSYDHQICGIEYYKILANIRDAQIIHNIDILNTIDKLHTARELKFLVERYTKNYDTISSRIKVTGAFDDVVEKCKPTDEQQLRNNLAIMWTNLLSKSRVQTKITPSLKGVKMAQTFTVRDWILGKISEEQVRDIKINNRRLDGWQIEILSQPMTTELQHKALECIKGISSEFGKAILDTMTITDLLKSPNTAKATVLGARKLGKANREKIIIMFRTRCAC